ncbi:hypothetical protein HK405_007114 [Cladochytrium tenue]|nr:hypothetical protein HK405_007114 [Cladochytrium tenue]
MTDHSNRNSGSHIISRLMQRYPQYVVFNFDKLDYCASLDNLRGVEAHPNYHFIRVMSTLLSLISALTSHLLQGDITSFDFVNYVLQEQNIDTIIHAAAQSHVDNSFGDSFSFTQNNVVGTHVLLQAARVNNISCFVHVSTDEVYGEVEPGNPEATENTLLAPTNPYAATKAAAECIARAYFKSFKLPVVITRSNNVYGPNQFPEKIVSKFITSILSGEKWCASQKGLNSRHFLYVTDVADGIIDVLHKGMPGLVYNLGTDFEISNLALARYLLVLLGRLSVPTEVVTANGAGPGSDGALPGDKSSRMAFAPVPPAAALLPVLERCGQLAREDEFVVHVEDRPFNDRRYPIDSTRAHALGWAPLVHFDEGIRHTVDFYARLMANTDGVARGLRDWWPRRSTGSQAPGSPSAAGGI